MPGSYETNRARDLAQEGRGSFYAASFSLVLSVESTRKIFHTEGTEAFAGAGEMISILRTIPQNGPSTLTGTIL
jgi:hypothetical protein